LLFEKEPVVPFNC